MPKRATGLAAASVAELKKMLAVKEKVGKLEKKKATLEKEIAKIDAEIEKLLSGKPVRKKVVRKKKAAKKRVAKRKVAKKKVVRKKVAKKAAKKRVAKTTKAPRVTVESVVVDLLKAHGKPMAFQDILSTIQKKKLIKSKSKNFANVLRRTVSASKKIKNVSRGVYRV